MDRKNRRVNSDGQPTHTHHGVVGFLLRECVHYQDKPEVATAAVAPNDNTTECSAIKIRDPRLVKPVTNLSVYVPPIWPPMVGTSDSILIFSNPARQLRLGRLQRPQFNLVTK